MQNYFGPFYFGELKQYNSKYWPAVDIRALQFRGFFLPREICEIKGMLTLRFLQYDKHYKQSSTQNCLATNRVGNNLQAAIARRWFRRLWTWLLLLFTITRLLSSCNWCGSWRRRYCSYWRRKFISTRSVVAVPRHLTEILVWIHLQSAADCKNHTTQHYHLHIILP